MNDDDWLDVVPGASAMLEPHGPDEQFVLMHGRVVRIAAADLSAMVQRACTRALAQACFMAGVADAADLDDFAVTPVAGADIGLLRVVATHTNGATGSAIAFLSDPHETH